MKKQIIVLLLLITLSLGLFTGCGVIQNATTVNTPDESPTQELTLIEDGETDNEPAVEETEEPEQVEAEQPVEETEEPEQVEAEEPEESDTEPVTEEIEISAVTEDGEYTSPEEVAEYIHTYGHLPSNFITKNEARSLGWDSSAGNLWDVAPNKSIGGDRFGNYEGLLPEGRWKECDVNYNGGYRGAERLIFNSDGAVYYTNDHYKTFTQLY